MLLFDVLFDVAGFVSCVLHCSLVFLVFVVYVWVWGGLWVCLGVWFGSFVVLRWWFLSLIVGLFLFVFCVGGGCLFALF